MSYEMSLRKTLENRNKELYGRLLKVEKIARTLLSYTHGKFPYYTPHDFSHSLNVEEHLNWIIADDLKEKMNTYEIFFLLVASWMHDWGMVGKPGEDPVEIRETHHLRTERYFEEMFDSLFLSEHESGIIGRICSGHTKRDLYDKDFDDIVFGSNIKIRMRFLAAVLRIADECDIAHNRTPEVIYYSLNPTDKAKGEFKRHLSIRGVGQLAERHKIHISAVARNPIGAKTLREVTDKLQRELNKVKGILAQHGIILDYVELKLETRGFIDKPISFEVDKKKIVDLLIGEHLYKSRDIAIRELVQNSIDSCKLRAQIELGVSSRITLRTPSEDIIEVEDNGIGMDYSTAKKYLSTIGASFYSSEEFRRLIKEEKFDPIARFGIGIMSCFLISEEITIETKKKGFDPCRFTITHTEQVWTYEKGSLEKPGTIIVLKLNKNGKLINTKQTLEKYFVMPEIQIYYQADNGEIKEFESTWTIDRVVEQFYAEEQESEEKVPPPPKELLRFETQDYKVILGAVSFYPRSQLALFNHGTFVGKFGVFGLDFRHMICVDVKKDLFDLQVSREDVIKNEKWRAFVKGLFTSLFDTVSDRFLPDNWREYIRVISHLTEQQITFAMSPEKFERQPFCESFFNRVFFPVETQKGIQLQRLDDVAKYSEITLYNIYSRKPLKEIEAVSKFGDKSRVVVFNPYISEFKVETKKDTYEDAIHLMLKKQKIEIRKADLSNIIIQNSSPADFDFEDLIPRNVKMARFAKDLKPLVVIYKKPVISRKRYTLGSSYYGNILLWRSLIADERAYEALKNIPTRDYYLEDLELVSEPMVYVDLEDEFLAKLLDLRGKKNWVRKHQVRYSDTLGFFRSCLWL